MVFRAIRWGNRSTGVTLIAFLAGLAFLAGSCGNGGYLYVSSSDRNAYFKVPANWKFYDKRDLLVASGQSLSAESNRQISWLIGYDADPTPSIDHILSIADAPKYPVIQASVQQLALQVRDQLSLSTLRNQPYPLDRLMNANLAEMLSYKDVTLKGGLHGIRMTFEVSLNGLSNVSLNSEVIWVSQVSLVDPATQKLYQFVLRCESHCYRDNKTLLDTIADSWTVKER
jgi:hypothetical protein